MIMREEIKGAVEAILFARAERVSADELVEILDVPLLELKPILREMMVEYREANRGIQLILEDGYYTLCSKPEYSDILSRMIRPVKRRLSSAALETLALIAYRQPITRAEIESIRGVKGDKTISGLLERGLIEEVGIKPVIGKPILYGTGQEFLRAFGLASLQDLPGLEEE